MATPSSRRLLVVERRIEKDLTSRLLKPLTRPSAGGRNASGALINIEVINHTYFISNKFHVGIVIGGRR